MVYFLRVNEKKEIPKEFLETESLLKITYTGHRFNSFKLPDDNKTFGFTTKELNLLSDLQDGKKSWKSS